MICSVNGALCPDRFSICLQNEVCDNAELGGSSFHHESKRPNNMSFGGALTFDGPRQVWIFDFACRDNSPVRKYNCRGQDIIAAHAKLARERAPTTCRVTLEQEERTKTARHYLLSNGRPPQRCARHRRRISGHICAVSNTRPPNDTRRQL